MAAAIVNKLLHRPTVRLRGEQGGPLADAAADLFGLQDGGDPAAPEREDAPRAASGEPPAETGADVLPLTGRK